MRVSQPTRPLCCGRISDSHIYMKLAVLIAALCTASCTAITLAPERPKPQLQRANKVLALRGGGGPSWCKSTSSPFSIPLFVDCFKASDGLIMVFLWGSLYLIGALGWLNLLPEPLGGKVQNLFESIYGNTKQGELGYIRFEILFILSSLVNTYVILFAPDQSARLLRSTAVWATLMTLIIIKFYFENQRGWIADHHYAPAQIFHAIFAASLWYGVLISK